MLFGASCAVIDVADFKGTLMICASLKLCQINKKRRLSHLSVNVIPSD